MTKMFIVTLILGVASLTNAQIVNIPDANFKASLVANSEINTNGDDQIQVSEAIAFTGTLTCGSENITNLTGIEAFVNITGLWCMQNQLTYLDISKNIALTYLDCSANQLKNLDISKNIALKNLWCFNNQLTSVDVTKNINLHQIGCYRNPLTSLNISQNTALEVLICYGSQLISLDTSKNLALKELYCYRNQLINLDVSKNIALTKFYCDDNQLIALNLKNGQNTKILNFDATTNPNLSCIQVDNTANSNSYTGWKKDVTASYSTNCLLSTTEIEKQQIKIYPNPAKDNLNFSEEVSNIKISELSGKLIKLISTSEKSINISKLAKGTYIISATTKNGEIINKKFIKE